jgi:hypothetical protein
MPKAKTVGTLICSECKTKRRLTQAERDAWFKKGASVPCVVCGNQKGNSLSDDATNRAFAPFFRFT